MRNLTRDQIIANFEELIAEDQIQTAVDLLVAAEPDEELVLIEQTSGALLDELFQALSADEREELTGQLSEPARARLAQVLLGGVTAPGEMDESELITRYQETRAAAVQPTDALASGRRKDFAIVQGHLFEVGPGAGVVTVFSNPTGQEQRALVELGGIFSGIDEHTLASALDPDEISRLEFDPDAQETIIVWKRPRRGRSDQPELLGLASLGMYLQADHLTIVTADDAPLLRAGDRAESLHDVLLRVMDATANEFLVKLKAVKRTSQESAQRLSESLDNRELLRMFNLSEALVYHLHAMEANRGVLRRLRDVAKRIGFDEQDFEFLEDIIIDNNQCIRQGQIFSTVLAGLMDARGNIINNNMNVLLKNLTMINVVFLPLGVLASIGGMSEFTMMLQDHAIDWRIGYAVFMAVMVALGAVIWVAVRTWTGRMFGG